MVGSIPAWAGEPYSGVSRIGLHGVYPRVGGGTGDKTVIKEAIEGLSPRGRGNPRGQADSRRCSGSIPAWAGEPFAV